MGEQSADAIGVYELLRNQVVVIVSNAKFSRGRFRERMLPRRRIVGFAPGTCLIEKARNR
jgi:hypothetical protein